MTVTLEEGTCYGYRYKYTSSRGLLKSGDKGLVGFGISFLAAALVGLASAPVDEVARGCQGLGRWRAI